MFIKLKECQVSYCTIFPALIHSYSAVGSFFLSVSLSRAACVTRDDHISSVWSRAAQSSFCISLAVSVHSWA